MTDMLPQVYLSRYGETAWSLSGQATGRTDIPLTNRGERDAQELAKQLQGLSFVQVLTSPSQRARRTAVLAGFDEGGAQPGPDLLEWDYGAYEGRRTAEIPAERPGWRLFEDGCPDGETLQAVSVRADRVINRVRALGGNVLVFAHRDILRVLAARWLGLPATDARYLFLTTASLSILGYHHDLDEPVILLRNERQRRNVHQSYGSRQASNQCSREHPGSEVDVLRRPETGFAHAPSPGVNETQPSDNRSEKGKYYANRNDRSWKDGGKHGAATA